MTSKSQDSTDEPVVPVGRAQTTDQDADETREELLEPQNGDNGGADDRTAGPLPEIIETIVPLPAWGPAATEEITMLPPEWRWG
jgi:hypothetical protein